MSGEFPDPPEGSPGGVRAAARSIGQAGDHFEAVAQGLVASSGALQADWHGWAANAYLGCTHGLAGALRSGIATFRACEDAISSYAGALEHAQDEIKKLHQLWTEAKARQADAVNALNSLATQMVDAKPEDVSLIATQMDAAGNREATAAGDADRLVRRAHDVLDDFKREQRRQADVLSGHASFSPTGALGGGASPFGGGVGNSLWGPGFGVPPGGLGSYNGVIKVDHPVARIPPAGLGKMLGAGDDFQEMEADSTNIPGYFQYYEKVTGNAADKAEPVSDLTDAVLIVGTAGAGSAADGLFAAARGIASGAGRRFGLTGGRAVVDAAGRQAELETSAVLAPTPSSREAAIQAARRNAETKVQAQVDAVQGKSLKSIADLASNAGVPLPPGAGDVLGHFAEYQGVYRYYGAAKLLRLQMSLEAKGTPAALKAAAQIERVLKVVQR